MLSRVTDFLLKTNSGRVVVVVILGVAGLLGWLAWWLAVPPFTNEMVEDDFPFSTQVVVPTDMTQEEVEKVNESATLSGTEVPEAAVPPTFLPTPEPTVVYPAETAHGVCGFEINTCSVGTVDDYEDREGYHSWGCFGIGNGNYNNCTAIRLPPDFIAETAHGVCGFEINTCSVGTVDDYEDREGYHSWGCFGIGNGNYNNCTAIRLPPDFIRVPTDATASGVNKITYSSIGNRLLEVADIYNKLEVTDTKSPKSSDSSAFIHIKDDALYYSGITDRHEYNHFVTAIESHSQPIRKIFITSLGGNTVYGKLFGAWIHENNVDVQVQEICFSSCANYIFPAGQNKYIESNSLVGWHGDVLSNIGACSDSDEILKNLAEMIFRNLALESTEGEVTGDEFERLLNLSFMARALEREIEKDFFINIGVDHRITNLPFYSNCANDIERQPSEHEKDIDRHFEETGEFTRVLGDTFSIESMNFFGINNVFYLGGGRYPETRTTAEGEIIQELGLKS